MKNLNTVNKKVLILGGSGYIGRHLFAGLGAERSVATYCSHFIKGGIYFDALNMNIADIILKPEEFSHAVILLGYIKPDFCVKNVKQSSHFNVTRICAIISQLREFGITPVFISTEVVFDGKKGDYVETDQTNPILMYGKQKVRVEQFLQKMRGKFLIVRIAKIFGSEPGDETLFTEWLGKIEQGIPISCAKDQIFSPIHIDEVVRGLTLLIQNNCEGVFHLCDKNAYCRLDMLKMLIKHYLSYEQKVIKVNECSLHDIPLSEKRPLNISMRPDKLIKATGLEIRNLEDRVKDIVRAHFLLVNKPAHRDRVKICK